MEKEIGEMMASRIQTKEFDIEQVRKPGQRVPISGIARLEGPFYRRASEAVPDMGIFSHILGVIVIIELEMPDRPIEGKRD